MVPHGKVMHGPNHRKANGSSREVNGTSREVNGSSEES